MDSRGVLPAQSYHIGCNGPILDHCSPCRWRCPPCHSTSLHFPLFLSHRFPFRSPDISPRSSVSSPLAILLAPPLRRLIMASSSLSDSRSPYLSPSIPRLPCPLFSLPVNSLFRHALARRHHLLVGRILSLLLASPLLTFIVAILARAESAMFFSSVLTANRQKIGPCWYDSVQGEQKTKNIEYCTCQTIDVCPPGDYIAQAHAARW